MPEFNAYARYYDLIYRDKEYENEAAFIQNILTAHAPGATSLLELGCGTGRHAELLAKSGYAVCGIDRSEEMLANARQLHGSNEKLTFLTGDIRNLSLGRHFDAVISLFHVMSYQTDNASLSAAFGCAAEHLVPGGLFIFDCWYGPGVLADPPEVRIKRLEDDSVILTRIAEPVIYPHKNMVDINYEVLIRKKNGGDFHTIRETHGVRYLFAPEVAMFAEQSGMVVERVCEWLTGKELPEAAWQACFILRKT